MEPLLLTTHTVCCFGSASPTIMEIIGILLAALAGISFYNENHERHETYRGGLSC